MTARGALRTVGLGAAVGAVGAVAGALVAAARDADVTNGIAWGLYIAGGVLLLFGAGSALQASPGLSVAASLPDAVREQMQAQQRRRISGGAATVVNVLVAAALVGLGALFEIYG